MAVPDLVRGTYLTLLLGDGATPEVFAVVCGLTTRSFSHQVNTNAAFIRDCADPEDIPHRRLTPTGEQWDLSGQGVLNRADLERVQAAMGQRRNWRYVIGEPVDDLVYGGYYAGRAMLTNLTITGGDESDAEVQITLLSDGPWAFVAVP